MWNFSTWDEGSYEDITKAGMSLVGKWTIDANTKIVDDYQYTKRLKSGGNRTLSFNVNGNCTISIIACSSSSSEDRLVTVETGETQLSSYYAKGGAPETYNTEYIGGKSQIFISTSGGVNFYCIRVLYPSDIPLINGLYYNIVNNKASCAKAENDVVNIDIPPYIIFNGNSYPVTSIAHRAFQNNSQIESIILPNTVTVIGTSAFENCVNLQSITIPNSLISINNSAFKDCNKLNTVSITDVGSWFNILFESIDSNPLTYAHCLYKNGQMIENLEVPNYITSINQYALYGCECLNSIIIPESVKSIGISAFYVCM